MGIPRITPAALLAKFRPPDWNKQMPASQRPKFLTATEFKNYIAFISEENAYAFLKFLLDNIESNKYKFTLQPATIKIKGHNIPWIETKELISNLEVFKDTVRFKKGVHSSGLSYEMLAMILEYGQKEKGIPPRDVFRRSFEDFKPMMIGNVIGNF